MIKNKRQISFYSILFILSCIYSLSILLLSTLPIALLYQSIDQIETIQQSFKKHPLVDLKVLKADNSSNCIDYQMESLFNFTFPGIFLQIKQTIEVEFYSCKESDYMYYYNQIVNVEKLNIRYCQNRQGCLCEDGEFKPSLCNRNSKGVKSCSQRGDGENVYEQKGFAINYWGIRVDSNYTKNNSNISMGDDNDGSKLITFQLCGYYNRKYNFLETFNNEEEEEDIDKQQIQQTNTCNYKNKEYDLFNLSKFNNITLKDCPITKIEIVNIQQISNNDNVSQYVDIPTTEKFKIMIQRHPQQYAISDIEVSVGEDVCTNGYISGSQEQQYKYYLYDYQKNKCEKDNGFNSIEWSEIGQKDLIKINGQEEWVKKIPNFINDNKNLFYINTRKFPKISYQCRTPRVRSFLESEIDIYNIWYYQIFLCSATITFMMAIQFFRKGENRIKILIIYKIVLAILHIGIEIWVSNVLKEEMILPIQELSHIECVDKNTYNTLIDIKQNVKLTQFYLQLPFYVYVGILSIEILYLITLFLKRKLILRKKLVKNQRDLINDVAIVYNPQLSQNLGQLERDILRVQESAHNRNPHQENIRASHIILPANMMNPNSTIQIRMDEDSDLQDKGNSTKDTNSLKRDLEFF